MSELNITKENFENEVMKSELPVLIDFWASWCGPCRKMGPIVEELANDYAGKVKVCKLNVDDEPELAGAFRVASIPTIVLMKDGKLVGQSIGYRPKSDIEKMIKG